MSQSELHRLSAFSRDPQGGNPAGVWLGEALPEPAQMLAIAADVGYSETVFLAPMKGPERQVRYYSPLAEVSFCGHATIAAAAFLGERDGAGDYVFNTAVGAVPVRVEKDAGGVTATLTSVTPKQAVPSAELIAAALKALRWPAEQLDPTVAPMLAFAGAWHLVLAVRTRAHLSELDYDFEALQALCAAHNLTTLQLIWLDPEGVIHSRNPFPAGGVYEDPATGAAAAALGGYLRDAGLLKAPANFLIRQGEDMGRPSRLNIELPEVGGIRVSGQAVRLESTAQAA